MAHDHILLSPIRNSPNLEDQLPQEQGCPVIPQELGSFPSPPTPFRATVGIFDPAFSVIHNCSCILGMDSTENIVPNICFTVALLISCCLVMTVSLVSYSIYAALCYNIKELEYV
jgi:hypothetical protein